MSSLNIGVDVRGLEIESSLRRGIGRYVVNLLRALACGWDHRLVLMGDWPPWHVRHLEPLLTLPHVRYASYHPSFADDLDVFLLTDPSPVVVGRELVPFPLGETPCATIFYDLIPLAFRGQYLDKNPRLRAEYLARLDELQRVAAVFLTISEFVADDLQERLGIARSRLVPISGGLDDAFREPSDPGEVRAVLERWGIRGPYFFYTGGADFRKNLAGLLLAFQAAREQGCGDFELLLAGEIGEGWLSRLSAESSGSLLAKVRALGYVPDDDLRCLYAGAAAFVFPSLYEGFGLPALEAMACGCPVIASNGSSLREIVADAGQLVNPQSTSEIAAAMTRVVRDGTWSASLRERGRERAKRYTWTDVARRSEAALSTVARRRRRPTARPRRMRVLIQNRKNALVAPGGDTIVMEELFRALRAHDIEADIAVGEPDLRGVDLVHLINLTVRSVVEPGATNARRQHVPHVVTTLFEDWPRYVGPSLAALRLFDDYVNRGRDEARFREGISRLCHLPRGPEVGSREVAENAAALFACSESEAERLRAAYPAAQGRVYVAPFGIRPYAEISEQNKSIARERVGFERFVLCCGRLETRKNQLMLLKAMQDEALPIVLLSGGFTYQESYANLVLRFPMHAPVKILGRQGTAFLWNLMAAASVHVLPSWYELPGLVSLEAAAAGTAVVASDWGSIGDYLPEGLVHICQPDDPGSIRRAVEDALRAGPSPEAKAKAESFTWDRYAERTREVYERILTHSQRPFRSYQIGEQGSEKHKTPETNMPSPTPQPHRFDASIVIPMYNHATLTRECLEALSAAPDRSRYELIVVDNHSTDETPQLLQALEGDVTILRQPVNRGFAAACNLAARVASGEFLVFLNNDTRPLPGWLDALVECARQDSSIGAVGAKLLYPAGDVQHAGIAFNERRVPHHIFRHFAADHPAVNEKRDMQAVTAACMLVPTSTFAKLGGFDESYRNGFEDVDFCLRLREEGYRVVYEPTSVTVHREETSDGRKDHDLQNLERFLNRWAKSLLPDDSAYLEKYGYTIHWQNGIGTYQTIEPQAEKPVSPPNLEQARELCASGQLEEAAAMLQRVVEQRRVLGSDDDFEAWQTLGNCLAGLKRPEEAEHAYHAARKLKPKSERPYLGLGAVAMLQENWPAAMYAFMMALAANPDTMKGEFGVGLSLAARSLHDDAIALFSRVLEREPFNAEALFHLYRSAMESGQPRLAIEPLEKYLTRFPDDNNFLFNLCGAYWKAGELTRAADLCRQVLDRDPEHAAARDVLEHVKSTALAHA